MKRWIVFFLAMVMALSLCACGKDDTKDPTGAPTQAPTTPTENNGGENNNQDPESGNFSLLTDMTIRYGDGDDAEIMKMELTYDDDHDIVGYKAYLDGKLYMEGTCNKATTQPLTQLEYAEDGSVDCTYTYTYDANGNELTCVTTDADGEVTYTKTNTYTPAGLLETSTDNYSWAAYTYDEYGNELSYRSGSGDEVWSDTTYENIYEDGKLVEVKIYNDEIHRWTEHYDADGNLVLEINYEFDGSESTRDVYTYENGKLTLRVISYNGEESSRQEYSYNADGQLTQILFFDEGEPHGSNVYTYENGTLVNVKLYDHEELEGEYTLSYKKAEVNDAQAKKLAELYRLMMEEVD